MADEAQISSFHDPSEGSRAWKQIPANAVPLDPRKGVGGFGCMGRDVEPAERHSVVQLSFARIG